VSWLSPPELLGFGLVAARVAPTGLLLGLLTRGLVPLWIGLGWSLALAAGLSPGVAAPTVLFEQSGLLLAELLRELCIGLTFALAAAVPLLGLSFGVKLAESPTRVAEAPLSRLYVLAALLLLLSLGGHRALVGALSGSLSDVPVGSAILHRDAFLSAVAGIVANAFAVALALGLPLWMALWLLDLTLALIDRARQGSRELARTPERALLALLCLSLLLAPLTSRMPELLRHALGQARALVLRVSR
jgi:flagellar biosynthesis protein FliR